MLVENTNLGFFAVFQNVMDARRDALYPKSSSTPAHREYYFQPHSKASQNMSFSAFICEICGIHFQICLCADDSDICKCFQDNTLPLLVFSPTIPCEQVLDSNQEPVSTDVWVVGLESLSNVLEDVGGKHQHRLFWCFSECHEYKTRCFILKIVINPRASGVLFSAPFKGIAKHVLFCVYLRNLRDTFPDLLMHRVLRYL
ncbi:hypothetical protein ESY87_07720 [Subsaximicrobium wynnwilliamsii]|uniref:hypothetical protein n=1 Tax=Subsaximicrobium wynnwilliamsii TaxID=291179 RepID=UPI0011C2A554|nr:hypothetical protein [Subsaximicrobium wynnwilliamsii]TXD83893.1 hypothetical protein ESY87_07720 [Subsaximicrobium wynnwilliamsii]TXE02575.1 hypothetical protein ESY88_11285 [Subsaximicrobium wynnwilliamsii]